MGQKQKSRHVGVMSVLPLKADIHKRGLHLRLALKADIQAAGIEHVQAVSYLLDRERVNGGTRAKSAFSPPSSLRLRFRAVPVEADRAKYRVGVQQIRRDVV
jgi:hypothetical protein